MGRGPCLVGGGRPAEATEWEKFRINFLIQPPLEQVSLDSVQGMEVGRGALRRLPAQPVYPAKERALSSVQTLGCAGGLQ